jgi:hypothetical protein
MKNSKQSSQGLDFITPLVEITQEVGTMIFRAVYEIIKFGFIHYFKINQGMHKIDRKKLAAKKVTSNPEALGVDSTSRKELLLKEIDFSKHSFIVGASGFGKTNLITNLQEQYLKEGRPIIFIDPKADLEAMTNFKNLCESYNKKCHIFSESYSDSVQLNPVLEGSISQVTDRIMDAFDWSEPYYMDMCTRALRESLEELKKEAKVFSLKNIYDVLINKHDKKETTGLIVKLENIVKSDFGKYLGGSKSDLTISKVRNERSCLYIGLSTQGYGKTAMSLGKIFLGELLYHSYERLKQSSDSRINKNNPIAIFFDEFGALVTPGFIELENKCRGAGMDLTMAIQTMADIDTIDPQLTIQVMENAANWFILKQRVSSSAEMLSEAIGTVMTKKYTNITENGEKGDRGTEREVHEFAVHTDVIKNLNIGQCILLRQHPHKVNLINIRNSQGGIIINKKIRKIKAKEALI